MSSHPQIDPQIQCVKSVSDPSLSARVFSLLDAATHHDAVSPFSENFVRGLREPEMGHKHFLAWSSEGKREIVGVLAMKTAGEKESVWEVDAELVVAPTARRQGVARRLIEASGARRVWAHGNVKAARECARAWRWHKVRSLNVMRRTISVRDMPEGVPEYVRVNDRIYGVESFASAAARCGRDVVRSEWLRVNNEAFSWHPEQGGWDDARMEHALSAEWVDERDIILLWACQEKSGGERCSYIPACAEECTGRYRLAGFHWVKWLEGGSVAEIYVVALAPEFQGQHVGGILTDCGVARLLEHARAEGLDAIDVDLYVESDNYPAIATYERRGFVVAEEHVVYAV